MTAPTPSQIEFLRSIDTPTVCNLVEAVAPERRGFGYTVKHLHCPFPELPPIVGFAKTVTFKAKDAVPLGEANYMQKRLDYLDYVASEPQPGIMVMEDLDGEHVGYGAFWGEVQSNIHKALGCLGVVTNGSIRDIPMIAPGFQMLAGSLSPSHAYTHVEDFGVPVTVHGMRVNSGDLIHADQHGAVVVPLEIIDKIKPALDDLNAREARIIKAAKETGTVEAIIAGCEHAHNARRCEDASDTARSRDPFRVAVCTPAQQMRAARCICSLRLTRKHQHDSIRQILDPHVVFSFRAAIQSFFLQDQIHRRRMRNFSAFCRRPTFRKFLRISTPAFEARPVTGGERRGFIEKEQI